MLSHLQKSATSSRFEYYTRFIYTCSCILYYIYPKSKRARSIHSQKEPGKCRTLFHAYILEKDRGYQAKGNTETRGFRTRISSGFELDSRDAAGIRRFGVGCEHAIHHGAMNAVRST